MWLYSDQWAAGFFDGEGCIQIERRLSGNGISYYLNVQLTQNDVRPLEAVRQRYGGRITSASRNSHDRCFRWRASSDTAARFLQAVRPYLLVKRDQAERAIAFRSLIGPLPGRLGISVEQRLERQQAYEHFREAFRR